MAAIHGEVAPGFEPVRDAFAANFAEHGEVGAAFSLYRGGTCVVDLWGGVADEESGRPWEEDTLQLVFSTTKGATAICAHLLAQRSLLDLDAPVSSYWPEFAAEGKGDLPVRWLLSHRAGLPALDSPVAPDDVLGWTGLCEALAAQAPLWEAGTAHGYHALTYGHLVGEVVRRITGKSLGTFFKDEVATPLGLDFHIGLPIEHEDRVSTLIQLNVGGGADTSSMPEAMREFIAQNFGPDSLFGRALMPAKPGLDFNTRAVHAAEVPAANGITTARSLARMYAAQVGEVDGVRILTPETVAAATTEQSSGPDKVLQVPTRFGLGFMLHSEFASLLTPESFGHPGAGGSVGFGDPTNEVGFGYVMNKMQENLAGDPRSLGLIAAVRRSLGSASR